MEVKDCEQKAIERQYITNTKGILILSVIIGHFLQLIILCGGGLLEARMIDGFRAVSLLIYTFHMPAFAFVSGYLSKDAEKRRKRASGDLLLPYCLFNVLLAAVEVICSGKQVGLSNCFNPEFSLWYLLALYVWRIVLPDARRIRKVALLAVLLNITTCLFSGMDNTFACQRSVGFFVYFYLGYSVSWESLMRVRRIPKALSVSVLVFELIGFFSILRREFLSFGTLLNILAHTSTTNIKNWYLYVSAYVIALLLAIINSCMVLRLVPKEDALILRRLGRDTLPLYVSHAFIYVVVRDTVLYYCKGAVSLICATASIPLCLMLLTTDSYIVIFNMLVQKVRWFAFDNSETKADVL